MRVLSRVVPLFNLRRPGVVGTTRIGLLLVVRMTAAVGVGEGKEVGMSMVPREGEVVNVDRDFLADRGVIDNWKVIFKENQVHVHVV